jgi:hypothetical protein
MSRGERTNGREEREEGKAEIESREGRKAEGRSRRAIEGR